MAPPPVSRWGRDRDIGRRRFLHGVAALSSGALVLGACTGPVISTAGRATVSGWRAQRRAPYLIAHRGAGDLIPEHTIEGSEQAVGWQAEAVEVSVVRSADGVLFCQHDLDMDRTTTLTGAAAALGSAQIETARIVVPRLGPRWNGDRASAIPRLDAVLDGLGGRTVLCIEAKVHFRSPSGTTTTATTCTTVARRRGITPCVESPVRWPCTATSMARPRGHSSGSRFARHH